MTSPEDSDDTFGQKPKEIGGIGGTPVGLGGTIALALYLAATAALALYVLFAVWPDADWEGPPPTAAVSSKMDAGVASDGSTSLLAVDGGPSANAEVDRDPAAPVAQSAHKRSGRAKGSTYRSTRLFGIRMTLSAELMLLLLVITSGMIGSLVHSLRSLSWYVGNRRLIASWALQYVLQPWVGGLMALVFYVVVRGGLFAWNSGGSDVNPFGFAAVAVIIGMFSQQAALKLKEVADTLFTRPEAGKDSLARAGESPAAKPDPTTPTNKPTT